MTRKNIFDLLAEQFDIDKEIEMIQELFEETLISDGNIYLHLEDYVDRYLLFNWKQRNRCASCQNMKERLGIDLITDYKCDLNIALRYLEYVLNLMQLCQSVSDENENIYFSKEYDALNENILSFVEYFNFQAIKFEDEERVLIVEKNPALTSVAEIVDDKIVWDVIKYNHYLLKGDLESKRKILSLLGSVLEGRREELKKVNDKTLDGDIFTLLNKMNIRHNNITPENKGKYYKYVEELTTEKLEEWYDETYQLILLAFLEMDNIQRHEKVTELKEKYLI